MKIKRDLRSAKELRDRARTHSLTRKPPIGDFTSDYALGLRGVERVNSYIPHI